MLAVHTPIAAPVRPTVITVPLRPSLPRRWADLLSRTTALGLAGALLIAFGAMGAGSTLISDPLLRNTPLEALRFGHGRMLAVGAIYGGILVLAMAWVQLGRRVRGGSIDARGVLRTACVWAAPLLVCPPLFSRDLYTYLAQGMLSLRGYDPYTTGPAVLPLQLHENVHPVWMDTGSPYGPLHILLTRAVAAVSGDNIIVGVVLVRLVYATGLVLVCAALPGLCRKLHARTGFALWFTVANPLTMVLVLGGGHNDLLVIGLLAAATLFVLDRRPAAGFALLALAMAIKVTVVVAAPFLLWIVARQLRADDPGPALPVRLLRAVRVAVLAMVPTFLGVTLLAGDGFDWIRSLDVSSVIVNWLSAPTGLGELTAGALMVGDADRVLLISCMRLVGLVALAGLLVMLWWRSRAGRTVPTLRNAAIALALAAVLLPATLPWYYCWAITLASVLPWTRPQLALAAAASVWLIVAAYPNGEIAVANWDYVAVTMAVAAVTGCAAAYLGPTVADRPVSLIARPVVAGTGDR